MRGIREERPMSEDAKAYLNMLGWALSMILAAAGFTFPVWGAMFGIY